MLAEEFDAETLSKYAEAVTSGDGAVEAYIDRWGYEWERHANMDY